MWLSKFRIFMTSSQNYADNIRKVNQNHEKGKFRNTEHKIFKGLKFGGGQSYVTI
jgi:hypothetical protein